MEGSAEKIRESRRGGGGGTLRKAGEGRVGSKISKEAKTGRNCKTFCYVVKLSSTTLVI